MSIHYELKVFDRVSSEIGGGPALVLCSFFGGSGGSLYVPPKPKPGHLIEKLIGQQSFEWLCQSFGGETLHLPTLSGLDVIKTAGRAYALSRSGISAKMLAVACGISRRRADQVLRQLRLEGFCDLAETISVEKFENDDEKTQVE